MTETEYIDGVRIPKCRPDQKKLYVQIAQSFDYLDRSEVATLVQNARKRDDESLQKLILHHLRYPLRIWKEFKLKFEEDSNRYFCQMITAGNFAMVQAAQKYDPSKGYKFSTYSEHWIRRAMETVLQNK